MKFVIASAVSVAALALAAAGPAAARDDHNQVEVEHAVARVVVIVEDRTDVGVEIEQGTSGLPRVEVHREGNRVRIDGGLRGRPFGGDRIRNCRSGPADARQPGEGASVEVRDIGRVNLSAAPLIVIRTPRDVNVGVEGAVFGAVGRGASSISLSNAGCGDWTVANTDGGLDLSVAGSGDVRTGTTRSLDISMAGSGSVMSAATGELDVSIAGSGDVTVASVQGPVDVSIAGSGGVTVNGSAGAVSASIAGSGDVNVRGAAASVDASIMGSGDVNVGSVSGRVEKNVMGSGDVTVGR